MIEQTLTRSEKMKAAIQARQFAGLHFGRPPVFQVKNRNCKQCGKRFAYKHYPSQKRRSCCTQLCAARFAQNEHRKIPRDFETLYDLYWVQNLSTPEIATRYGGTAHKTVRENMIKVGIPRRKVGHSRITSCIIEECESPLYRIRHAVNGSDYGRRCLLHWVAHRQRLAKEYWVKIRRWRRHNLGISGETDIAAIIQDAVPKQLPHEIRDEVCQEIALELLMHKTRYSNLREAVQKLIKHFFKQYQDKYGDLSLDAPITEDGLTLGDVLEG